MRVFNFCAEIENMVLHIIFLLSNKVMEDSHPIQDVIAGEDRSQLCLVGEVAYEALDRL